MIDVGAMDASATQSNLVTWSSGQRLLEYWWEALRRCATTWSWIGSIVMAILQ